MQMQMTSADRGMIMTNFNRKKTEKMSGRVVVKGGVKAADNRETTTQMIRVVEQVLDKQETTLMRRFVEQVLDHEDHTSCKTGESVDYKSDFKECNRGGLDNGKKSPNGNGPEVERVKNLTRDTMQFPRPIQVNIIIPNLEPRLDRKLTEFEVVKGQDLIFKEECTGKDSEELSYLTGIEGVCGVKNSDNFTHSQGSHSVMSAD